MHACVCACTHACVHACMCACMHACVCACMCACMHACKTAIKRLSPGFQTVKYRLSPKSKPYYSSLKLCCIVEKTTIWLTPGFQTTKTNQKNSNPKNFQRGSLGIIAEKLHAKFESAAITGSWLKADLKLPLIATMKSAKSWISNGDRNFD